MAVWSQSHFLQALGWATLNSFWQMALLWCLYQAVNHILKLSSSQKYSLAVGAILTGFVWFTISLFLFYKGSFTTNYSFLQEGIQRSDSILNIALIAASVAYLALLCFPAYKLYNNWRYVQKIKKIGLHKAQLDYRLFTQKVAAHLGIGKKVLVFISDIVTSPVTIGYLKPIILLPVAAMNHLSVHQVEAVLLHELSHIKRYDYLVNLIINIVSTLLYFNPFVKQFMREVEAERENCCDELVLQFGYDKVGYASALLALEKVSGKHHVLALGATGKKNLLTRIEKIVGMEKKKGYSLAQFVPVLAALICIFAFNSLLIIKDNKSNGVMLASNTLVSPLYFTETGGASPAKTIEIPTIKRKNFMVAERPATVVPVNINGLDEWTPETTSSSDAIKDFVHVGLDEVDASLSTEQKTQVKKTVEATKKVLSTLQWKEVENTMADAMDKDEKAVVKEEYMKELENLNWSRIENNMKANYDKINWNNLNANLNTALSNIELDSLQTAYSKMLTQFERVQCEIASKSKVGMNPVPDQSLADIEKAKEQVRKTLQEIKAMRNKKVIHL